MLSDFIFFFYLFVFTHVETKTQLKKIFADADDLSQHKYRYNQWATGIVNDFVSDSPIGYYRYEVYEQYSATDETITGKNLVENGKAIIRPREDFIFENYNTETTYKAYNG